ncbi:conserved hypothetical protein [Bacillus sp. 349Y]|nr:conserved hypothetical protein [Bacillus sp. 349Y]
MKTITFSVSTNKKGSEISETFTLEDLDLNDTMSKRELEKQIEKIYKIWVWDQLSVSCVVEGMDLNLNGLMES